jgi:hypothetical protein
MTHFSVSGIDTYWWLPIVVSFGISTFTATGGVSGAFILLPFQMSVLGFTGPAVSPTNLVFNIFAIPSGVYRYAREKRLVAPIVWTSILGTLPGVFIGAILRIKYLPNPRYFKLFVASVLLYMGMRLALDIVRRKSEKPVTEAPKFEVAVQQFNARTIIYDFNGVTYRIPTPALFILCLVVGIIGGTYGIGGGAIIAPFLVTSFGLPIYTIAGAALLGTFVTSIAGVLFYSAIAPFYGQSGLVIQPDWALGALFGVGGAAGMYIGARLQKRLPERFIKEILTSLIMFVVVKYIWEFFKV